MTKKDYRTNLTIEISEDEGKTWTNKLLDPRLEVSYPEFDFANNTFYCTWDRERFGAKEILFCAITIEQIKDPNYKPEIKVVSKGGYY